MIVLVVVVLIALILLLSTIIAAGLVDSAESDAWDITDSRYLAAFIAMMSVCIFLLGIFISPR